MNQRSRNTFAAKLVLLVLAACASSPAPPTTSSSSQDARGGTPAAAPGAPGKKKSGELDKLMRTRMNRSYTQLVFYVLDSDIDVDPAKISHEAKELQGAVAAVRALPMPSMVQSNESREVYTTYNDVLQRDADKFFAAASSSDRPQMEALLTKIGKTCNDCHRFFRVDVKGESK